jgi:hypothetical protein
MTHEVHSKLSVPQEILSKYIGNKSEMARFMGISLAAKRVDTLMGLFRCNLYQQKVIKGSFENVSRLSVGDLDDPFPSELLKSLRPSIPILCMPS